MKHKPPLISVQSREVYGDTEEKEANRLEQIEHHLRSTKLAAWCACIYLIMKDLWTDGKPIERMLLSTVAAALLGICESLLEFLIKTFSNQFLNPNSQKTQELSNIERTIENKGENK